VGSSDCAIFITDYRGGPGCEDSFNSLLADGVRRETVIAPMTRWNIKGWLNLFDYGEWLIECAAY